VAPRPLRTTVTGWCVRCVRASLDAIRFPASCRWSCPRLPSLPANLVVEKKPNGEIVLDVHVTGACVIILDEAAARALFDILGTWLG
jgi:hypothetical protein